jgi:alkylhydroperoxidase family enzyme
MARIPYFDPADATGRAAEAYKKLPPLNIFRMLGHSGDMLDSFTKFGNAILMYSDLDPVLREIAIVRVGVLKKGKYEVHQHERISRQIGMSEDKIRAIHEGPEAAAFSDLEKMVMRLTDDIVANTRASDATFDPLLEKLGAKQMQELVLAIGFYTAVCYFLETFDVDIEEKGKEPTVNITAKKN